MRKKSTSAVIRNTSFKTVAAQNTILMSTMFLGSPCPGSLSDYMIPSRQQDFSQLDEKRAKQLSQDFYSMRFDLSSVLSKASQSNIYCSAEKGEETALMSMGRAAEPLYCDNILRSCFAGSYTPLLDLKKDLKKHKCSSKDYKMQSTPEENTCEDSCLENKEESSTGKQCKGENDGQEGERKSNEISATTNKKSKMEQYIEKRRKNNASAKKSREARRLREMKTQFRASCLEDENFKLRTIVSALKDENSQLRELLIM